jgi:hypothetical protein
MTKYLKLEQEMEKFPKLSTVVIRWAETDFSSTNPGYPILLNFHDRCALAHGTWQMRIKQIHVQFKKNTDDIYTLKCNLVKQNDTLTTQYLVHLNGEQNEKLLLDCNSSFFIVNQGEESIIYVLIDVDGSNDVGKSLHSIFKKVSVLIEYQCLVNCTCTKSTRKNSRHCSVKQDPTTI